MKIGLLEATFDPPHNGHLIIADEARIQFQLDQIWFIPHGEAAYPQFYIQTNKYIRARMVNAAIQGIEWAYSKLYEIENEGVVYSIDVIDKVKKEAPNDEFYWITGADRIRDICTYKNFQEILNNCTIIAAHRPDEVANEIFQTKIEELIDQYNAKILLLPCHYSISSTMVREKIKKGKSFRFLIPAATYDYIIKNDVYNVNKLRR